MFKAYQYKWCLTFAGVLAVTTLLLRQGSIIGLSFWEMADYVLRLFIIIIVCWTIHGYFLLHKFPFLTKSAKLFLTNFIAAMAIVIVSLIFKDVIPGNRLMEDPTVTTYTMKVVKQVFSSLFLSAICYAIFYSIHTNIALQTSKLENEILGQAHLRAQLLSLQQQISPHFLFNSLSTLKTIATDHPTKNYVVQLATVYRYVLNFNEDYLTPLENELIFIKSYLYIMDQRFEEALQVNIDIPEEHRKLMLPSLSLQLLVENAIKHNISSPDQPLHITITTDNSPALIVENNFRPKKILSEGTGTGLKNIRERYRLLAHRMVDVSNESGKFIVTLPLLKR